MNKHVLIVFYKNSFVKNIASFGAAFQVQTIYGFAYFLHNVYLKNVAAIMKQSKLSNFSAYNTKELGIGVGIAIIKQTDFIAYNETFFDNFASTVGNTYHSSFSWNRSIIINCRFEGEKLSYFATIAISSYITLIVHNCTFRNIYVLRSGLFQNY